jgi:DNA-binding transcriptional LysR family regulator
VPGTGSLHFATPPAKVVHTEWLKAIAPRAQVVLRTNGIQSHVAAVGSGEAIAVLPRVLVDRRPGFVRIEPPLPEPFQPVKIGVMGTCVTPLESVPSLSSWSANSKHDPQN